MSKGCLVTGSLFFAKLKLASLSRIRFAFNFFAILGLIKLPMRKIVVVFFFLFASNAEGQRIKNLVLEGAGIRGIAYCGAIKSLEQHDLIKDIDKVGGTSAGAIAALALSLGYSAAEIETLIYNSKLQKFNDGQFFFIGGLARLNRNYGWYRGDTFMKWIEEVIEKKTGDANVTFEELNNRGFKKLYVTGTSLNNQRLLVFSPESYPKMKIKDAVRISMSIPLYFEAVIIDSIGNVIRRKNFHPQHDLVVDGGFTGNFPITLFDSTDRNGDVIRIINKNTVGLRIDTPQQIQYDVSGKGLAPVPIAGFKNYTAAFYNYVIENLNRTALSKDDWARTVSISSGEIGPKIKKLTIAEKDLLIANGYQAMEAFLSMRE
jgi:NTE family protein